MLYVHQLKDLTPKSSEIESVFIIRDLKKQTPLPLTDEKVRKFFQLFFVSESEKVAMANALEILEPTVVMISQLSQIDDPDFEKINLQRAIAMLEEIPAPLMANLQFAKALFNWQEEFVYTFAGLINSIPKLKNYEDKVACNSKLNKIFEMLLRNDVMAFEYKDIINEAQTTRLKDLAESMERGFFFKVFLEEELKKLEFSIIKRRIPDAKLRAVENIHSKITEIKKGVDAAYDINIRMVNWALVVYSYIKWITSQAAN